MGVAVSETLAALADGDHYREMAVKFKDLLTDYAPCVLTPDS
jgi:hypothetical protein